MVKKPTKKKAATKKKTVKKVVRKKIGIVKAKPSKKTAKPKGGKSKPAQKPQKPRSHFVRDKKKGDVYEDKVYAHLLKEAKKNKWEVKRVVDVLGEGVYRFQDLCYPDFTIVKDNGEIFLIDAKIKKGYPESGNRIYVAIERKFYESYLQIQEMTEASGAYVYMHCELTGKDYKIDLNKTPYMIKVFQNEHNPKGEPSRMYYTDCMPEISIK